MVRMPNTLRENPEFAEKMKFATHRNTLPSRQIHILGSSQMARDVETELDRLGFNSIIFDTVKDLRAHTTGREGGIVFCSPLKRSEITSVFRNLQKVSRFRGMKFIALVPEWMNSSTERNMYKEGIQLVFEWPREREIFQDLFKSIIGLEDIDVHDDDSDHALLKAVKTRMLAKDHSIDPKVSLSVYNGIVIARGNIESVGAKRQWVDFIKTIPGVRGVVDKSLFVGSEILPGLVKTKAINVIEEMDILPEQTLDVQVSPDEKTLTLIGSTASLNTAEKAIRQLEKFKGVQRVENRVNVSPFQHARDLNLAKRGQHILNKISLGSPHLATLKVINGHAYIKGTASSAIQMHQMEQAMRKVDGIKSITNQLLIDQSVPVNFY